MSNPSVFLSGTPPRGRRRVWFADDILANKKSESAPTSPVRGSAYSPLSTRALGRPVKGPGGSPQLRRASRPHGRTINVGSPMTAQLHHTDLLLIRSLCCLQEACSPSGWGTTALVSSSANLIPLEGLPPILTSTGVKGGKRSSVPLEMGSHSYVAS